MTDRVGQQLGNYRLVRLLGQGGFAEVYLGEHSYLETQAAIKVLHTQLASEDSELFRLEARTIARLDHPHIVRILDFGVEGTTPFLVMSYAAGGTLRTRHPKGSRLELPTVVSYVKQIAPALQYAHDQKLIHRDIKPENLLLGKGNVVLLSDFGLVVVASSRYQSPKDMAGTIAYMAPEQIEARPRPASDQYSLGIVVYEWLSGDRPFHGTFPEIAVKHSLVPPPSLQEKRPTLPLGVEQVVLRALAKDPKQRFETIQAFASAFEQASQVEETASISLTQPPLPANETVPSPGFSQPTDARTVLSPSQQAGDETIPSPRSLQASDVRTVSSPSQHPGELITLANQSSRQSESVAEVGSPASQTTILPAQGPHATSPTAGEPQTIISPKKLQRGISRRAVVLGLAGLAAIGVTSGIVWLASSQSPVPSKPTNPALTSSGTMFGFDLYHSRFNSNEHILSPANVSHLTPYWSASTGGRILSSPVVANRIVYVGSYDGKLYAFNASTGSVQWTVSTGDVVPSSPAVASGVVYVGSFDSKLYALDAATGKTNWTATTSGSIDSSPAVVNGVVYIGSADHKLYAFDAATGTLLWSASTNGWNESSPAVVNGVIYIGSDDHKLYAFDATTGAALWSFSTGDWIASSPAFAEDVVYVGSRDHKLYAFNTLTNTLLWSASTGGWVTSSPAVANGVVYVGSYDHKLYAFDATTGKTLWTASTGSLINSSPIVANEVVYVGSFDGKLYAFDTVTGKILWTASTNSRIFFSSPTVANGVLYIGSQDNKLYAFHLPGKSP